MSQNIRLLYKCTLSSDLEDNALQSKVVRYPCFELTHAREFSFFNFKRWLVDKKGVDTGHIRSREGDQKWGELELNTRKKASRINI